MYCVILQELFLIIFSADFQANLSWKVLKYYSRKFMQNTVFIMTKILGLATLVKNVIICDGFGEQDKCLENKSILCHIILTEIMPIKVI